MVGVLPMQARSLQEGSGTMEAEARTILSTGIAQLDEALGVGGLPCGRLIEFFGPADAGKRELLLRAIAAAQREGRVCAFVNVGRAFDPAEATRLGVQLDALLVSQLVSQPDGVEQGLQVLETLLRTGAVDLMVVGLAAETPPAETTDLVEELRREQEGFVRARRNNAQCRKIAALVSRTSCVVAFALDLARGATGPLNNALKYYSSVRVDVRRVGQVARVKIVKNKVAAPFREAEIPLMPSDVACGCGHFWSSHTRIASGADACRHFGCGCSDYEVRS